MEDMSEANMIWEIILAANKWKSFCTDYDRTGLRIPKSYLNVGMKVEEFFIKQIQKPMMVFFVL